MDTLHSLKLALRKAIEATSSAKQPLSDSQYSAGFDILIPSSEWATYQDFILPQLHQVLAPLFNSRTHISVLEIGPGPKSVLGHLPGSLRRKIKRYFAFEPNVAFATRLEERLCTTLETEVPLPCLECPPVIHQIPFVADSNTISGAGTSTSTSTSMADGSEKFDVVLFCHSMYGMKPKRRFIERALEMLVPSSEGGGMVVVFHRDGTLALDGLVCHRTASFPGGTVSVPNEDKVLDVFSAFMTGFVMQDMDADKATREEWRKICRGLGRREDTQPDRLVFSSPNVMMVFNQHATALPELTGQVPLVKGGRTVKSREAREHAPAAMVRPTEIKHVQDCVRWALKHQVGLTVVGGGHSGHCLWPNVVAVDMEAFDDIHILREEGENSGSDPGSVVVVGAGCKTGDIISKTMAAGLTVPLGARPSGKQLSMLFPIPFVLS